MSRAAEFTFAVVAVSAALWFEVRGLEPPVRRIIVDFGDEVSSAAFFAPLIPAPAFMQTGIHAALITPTAIPRFFIRPDADSLPHIPPVFLDRFSGLDEAQLWAVSDGWANGSWTANDWRRRQLRTGAEGLEITLAASRSGGGSHPYASGEVSTHEKYRYGYFEARLHMPRGSGLVAGVFTFTRDAGPETWNEIDMEILGRDTRSIELSYIVGGAIIKQVVTLPFDAADGFHTYAFDWRPDAIRWYVDDQLVHESREVGVARLIEPQRFILNLWNSEELQPWVGPIARDAGPWTMTVSCVAHAAEYPGRSLCQPESPARP